MNENIDLTKILDGCPIGTEFYHTGYGRVWLVGIDLYCVHPIRLSTAGDSIADVSTTEKGTLNIQYEGECLLFPSKDQRDWSKFERFWDKKLLDKPVAEKFDPKTLQPFDKILVRNSNCNSWVCDLFSHIKTNIKTNKPCLPCFYPIVGLSGASEYCVPYNDETKHLIGTANDCPEFYKWWEE